MAKMRREKKAFVHPLHEVIISKTIITTVGVVIDLVLPIRNKRNLSLSSLRLLVSLIRSTLLTHLLITSSSERTGNLLDLSTRQLLHKLAGEILSPNRILRLLGVRRKQREKNIRQTVELVLSGRLEESHRRQIDGVGRVRRISDDDSLRSTTVALHIDVREEISRMLQVRVLLLLTKALAALSIGLIGVKVASLVFFAAPLLAAFLYPLGLGFLVRSGLSLLRGLDLGGLLSLLALDLGVFGGIPGV